MIIEQVVNPKVLSVFKPAVDVAACRHLNIDPEVSSILQLSYNNGITAVYFLKLWEKKLKNRDRRRHGSKKHSNGCLYFPFATKNRILVLDYFFLALKCLEDDEDAANRSGSSDLLSPPAHNSFTHAPNFKDFPVPQFPMPPVIINVIVFYSFSKDGHSVMNSLH